MDDVWVKVAEFLGTLNGENVSRKYYVVTPKYRAAQERLQEAEEEWEAYLQSLPNTDREKAETYLDCLDEMASRSEQRAYMQGYVDCVQVLCKMGLIKENVDLKGVEGIAQEKWGRIEKNQSEL